MRGDDFLEKSGDLAETFYSLADELGLKQARIWYWRQAIKALPALLFHTIHWRLTMLNNYLKIAFRHMKKNSGHSMINIIGLTVGLMVTIVLVFYVLDDLSYDAFHENKDTIYRVLSDENGGRTYAVTSGPLLPAAERIIPEVVSATRITMANQTGINRAGDDEEMAIDAMMILADPEFFNVFSFEILQGADAEALRIPGSVFLTSETASALFQNEDPIGKPLQLDLFGADAPYVAGIVETPPHRSHLQFDMIVSFIPESNPVLLDSWENQFPVGYIRVEDGARIPDVESKIVAIARSNGFPEVFTPRLQALSDIHLGSTRILWDFNVRKNDRIVVNTLGAIGILVLLVACINFINLSTTQAMKRAREVGIRKVSGSKRIQIAVQFLGEFVLVTVVSFSIAVVWVKLNAGSISALLDKPLNLSITEHGVTILILLLCTILTGLLSGVYPSIVLSSFKPVDVLKGEFKSTGKGLLLRRVLVVFQFIVTTSLVTAVLIIHAQIRYLKSRDMGFDRENVLAIRGGVRDRDDTFGQMVAGLPGVESLGRINQLPDANFGHVDVTPEGTSRTEGYQPVQFFVNYDLLNMLGVPIVRGRNFSREFMADTLDNVIVNEELVRNAGWDDPIGKRVVFYYDNRDIGRYQVVGVVKDFHYGSPKQTIEPTLFHLAPSPGNLLVRLHAGRVEETLRRIEAVHAELFPDRDFHYSFLDGMFDLQFNTDRELAGNIATFAVIAIFVACLGLLGLVSYSSRQRRKEMAVRKVLGCGGKRIVRILVFDYLKWIALANAVAWPLVFFAMGKWLDSFVYKATFSVIPYILGGTVTVGIALSIILSVTLRAARVNPAEALKCE